MNITTESKEFNIDTVMDFAKKTHKGQMYGEHDYYDYHLLGVRELTLKLASTIYGVNIVGGPVVYCACLAMLHDTIEDHDVSRDSIHCNFGDAVLIDLIHLSRHPDIDYDKYISNLVDKGSLEAIIVKLADLKFNINAGISTLADITDPAKRKFLKTRIDKYKLTYRYILTVGSSKHPQLSKVKLDFTHEVYNLE